MSFPNSQTWLGDIRSRPAMNREKMPATKTGQIKAIWAEIETALLNAWLTSESP
jgi:hypothetical protein